LPPGLGLADRERERERDWDRDGDGDRDFSSLACLGDGESGGDRSCAAGGDLDLEPDGRLLETNRARSPCDLGFPAGGERLRTGLLL